MSRGLGARQFLILEALYSLEQERNREGAWFYTWAVLKAAWKLGPEQEIEAWKALRRAEREHTAKLAAAGDADAKRQDDRNAMMDMLALAIGRGPRRSRARKVRPVNAESTLNPSRILAGLAKRGLVLRDAQCGRGSGVSLTALGRELIAATGRPAPPGYARHRHRRLWP